MESLQFIRKKQFWAVVVLLLISNLIFLGYRIQKEKDREVLSDRQITTQEFGEIVKNREEAYEQKAAFQIFSSDSSFAGKNIIKEQKDYKNSFKIQIKEGNNRVITAVISQHETAWLIFFFVFYLIIQFHREREGEMWYVMHSLPNGRGRLSVKRCGVIIFLSIVFNLSIYLTSFAFSSILLGGKVVWGRGIQSIEAFVTLPQAISILQFCLLFVVVHIFGCCCVGLFIFFIFSCCKEKLSAFLWCATIGMGEYLFTLLPLQSNLVIARIWNFFSFVDMTNYFITYRNIPIPFGGIMEMLPLCLITCGITGVLSFLGAIYVNHKIMPGRTESLVQKIFRKGLDYIRKVLSVLPNIGMELFKQIVSQKKWCVLVLLCVICFYTEKPILYFPSPTEVFLDEFYMKFSGTVENEEVDTYLENVRKEIQEAQKNFKIAKEHLKKGIISLSEYENYAHAISGIEGKIEGYKWICKERMRLKNIQNSTGIAMKYVNPKGYEPLCHSDYWNEENKIALFAMFVLLLLLFDVGSYEKKIGMTPIICSTSKGRNMLFRNKMYVAVFYAIFSWILIYGFHLWNVSKTYGGFFEPFAPVQSLASLDGVAFHCSICQYFVLVYLWRLLILILVSFFILGISCLLSKLSTFCVVFGVAILPSILYCLGIEQMGLFSFSKILALLHYPGQKMGTYCFYVGVLLIGTFFSLLIGKRVCFTRSD